MSASIANGLGIVAVAIFTLADGDAATGNGAAAKGDGGIIACGP